MSSRKSSSQGLFSFLFITNFLLLLRISSTTGHGALFQFQDAEIRVPESNGIAEILIENAGNTNVSATLSVFTADVTATDGEDYIEHNGQLIFQPGDSLKSVNITIIQDGIAEGEESFVANLTLIDNTGPSAALGQSTLTVIIDDDEAPPTVPPTPGTLFQFQDAEIRVLESNGIAEIFVEKSGNTSVSATLFLFIAGGNARDGEDYIGPDGQLEFGPDDALKSVNITILDDLLSEGEESIVVLLGLLNASDPNVTFGQTTVRVIIEDDDGAPPTEPPTPGALFQFQYGAIEVPESFGNVEVVVENVGNTNVSATLSVSTVDGNAAYGRDYIVDNEQLEFEPGDAFMTVNITIVDDFVVEGDESFEAILTLLNTTDPNTALGNTTLTVIIKNDDGLLPPTPEILDECFNNAVGLAENSTTPIPDNQMTASSIYSNDDQAYYGRLNGTRGYGWCARSNDSNPWLQIDLGREFEVCGVATQGGTSSSEWTTHFKLSFSSDGNIWTFYQDEHGNEVEFVREGEAEGVDRHKLPEPVTASYIRFHPTQSSGIRCLRVEVYGVSDARYQFEDLEIRVSESSGFATIVIENIGNKTVTTDLSVSTSDASAANATDYIGISQEQVLFAPGDVTKEVNITIIDDDEIEGDESFEVNLQFVGSSDPNSALGERTRLTVIIEDDDEPSTPDFTGDAQEAVLESINCEVDGQGIAFVVSIPDIAEWGVGDEVTWALVGTSDASCQPNFTVNAGKVTYGPFDGNVCKTNLNETDTHLEFQFEIDARPSGGLTFAYDHHYLVTCRYNKEKQDIQASFTPLHSVSNTGQDFGLLTFSFELRFTADGSEVDPDDTIDLTTGILGRLTVVGPDSLALDVHYDAVTAVADNGESATLIIEGCSNNTNVVNNLQCSVGKVEDFILTNGAFRFSGQTGNSSVTFYVTAVVCLNNPSTSQCEIECASCGGGIGRKRRESLKESLETKYYLTAGPYKFSNVEQVQKDSAVDKRDGSAFPTSLVVILVVSGVVAIAIISAAVIIVLRQRRRTAAIPVSRDTHESGTSVA